MTLRIPYLMFIGDAPDQLAAKTAAGVAFWRPEVSSRPVAAARLQGRSRPPRHDDRGRRRGRGQDRHRRHHQSRRRARRGLGAAAGAGARARHGSGERPAPPPRRHPGAARRGRALRPADRRCAPSDPRVPCRQRRQAAGQAAARRSAPTARSARCSPRWRSRGRCGRAACKADFRATGQTGILIAGDGVSIDAVVSDFVSGAVEWLCPANDPDHWDLIEGQGSLFHASYAGVTLGLIHGAQPDALVMCHEPTRPHMRGLPGYKLPDLEIVHRAQCRGGAADQPGGALRRAQHQHRGARRRRRRAIICAAPRTDSACPASIRCAPASARSSTTCGLTDGAAPAAPQRHPPVLAAGPAVRDLARQQDDRRGRRRRGS